MSTDQSNSAEVLEKSPHHLLELAEFLAKNLRQLLIVPLAVGLLALAGTYAISPTYTAKMQLLPPQSGQSSAASVLAGLGAIGGLAGAASGLKNPVDQYMGFLKSRTVQTGLIDRLQLVHHYRVDDHEEARKVLADKTRLTSGKDGLIGVEVDDVDPTKAALIANTYAEELQSILSRLAVSEAQRRRQFFEAQLKSAKTDLTNAETELRASGINSTVIKSTPAVAMEAVARLRALITAQKIKISTLQGYLTQQSPDLHQAQNELQALTKQLEALEAKEPTQSANDYVARFRNYKYYEFLYELFAKQYELARVDESREGALVQIVDEATAPTKKTRPKRALISIIAMMVTITLQLISMAVTRGVRHASEDPDVKKRIEALKKTILPNVMKHRQNHDSQPE